MRYTVHHPIGGVPAFPAGPEPDWPADYEPVGTIEADSLDDAYSATNDAEDWPCRSTSVGDVLADDKGNAHRCASFGWVRLHREPDECEMCGVLTFGPFCSDVCAAEHWGLLP